MSGFNSDLKRAEGTTKGFASRIRGLLTPKGLLGAGALFGLGSSIPTLTRQALGFAGDAAQAFGQLQQTVRTIDNVFGESAQIIRDWGKTAAETAGMSQQTFMSSAAVMGQTLLNMGFEQNEAAEKTVLLLQRAADLAIAFGKRPADALLAITAAMRGERDTIEKFGIAIKQVDVNARIAALGLDTSTAAAKKNAEAIAVVDLVLQQSAQNAGRFADSQDDIAVQMAKANARMEDFIALDVGRAVASIQLGAFKVGDAVGDELDKLSSHFGDNFKLVKDLADQAGVSWDEMNAQIVTKMSETGQSFDQVTGEMLAAGYEAQAEAFNVFAEVSSQAVAGLNSVELPVLAVLFEPHWDEIRAAGAETLTQFQLGIFDAQESLMTEIDALLTSLDERMAPAEEIAYLRGKKVDLLMARGVAEDKGDAGAVAAVDAMIAQINAQLNGLNGYSYGVNLAETLAAGMRDGAAIRAVQNNAYALGNLIRAGVGINSEPTDPHSPLRGITTWGGNMVKTIAEGIYGELGTASGASMALAGALVPSVGGGSAMGGMVASTGPTYILQVEGTPKEINSMNELNSEGWDALTRARVGGMG